MLSKLGIPTLLLNILYQRYLVRAGHTMKRKGDPLPYLKTAGLTLHETSHLGSVPFSD
jgi:hypothetical protein